METPKNALSPRPETDWMNDPSVSLQEHVDKVASFNYSTLDPTLISRYKAHDANIGQKEIRRNSILSNRKAIIAHRALTNAVEI